jgi:hypothetical protein
MKSISYKLEAIEQISGETYFVCKLLGKKDEDIKFFKSSTTGFRWRAHMAAFPSVKSWKKGKRTFLVTPLQPDCNAVIGDTLIGESDE